MQRERERKYDTIMFHKKPSMTGNRLILLLDRAVRASEHRCIVRQQRRHGKPIAALIGNHVNLVYAMPGKIILNLLLMTGDLFIKGCTISVL